MAPGGDLPVHVGAWGCVCVSDTCPGPAVCPWGPCRIAAVLWMRSGSAQQLQPRAQPGLCRVTAPGVGEAGEPGAVRPSLGVCCHLVASLGAWFCAGRGENLLDLPGASWPPSPTPGSHRAPLCPPPPASFVRAAEPPLFSSLSPSSLPRPSSSSPHFPDLGAGGSRALGHWDFRGGRGNIPRAGDFLELSIAALQSLCSV